LPPGKLCHPSVPSSQFPVAGNQEPATNNGFPYHQ